MTIRTSDIPDRCDGTEAQPRAFACHGAAGGQRAGAAPHRLATDLPAAPAEGRIRLQHVLISASRQHDGDGPSVLPPDADPHDGAGLMGMAAAIPGGDDVLL